MKITLDLPSVLTGGAVALVLGLVAGFTPQVTQLPGATNVAPTRFTSQAWPRGADIVTLQARANDYLFIGPGSGPVAGTGFESQVFTVPAGKLLVVTGFSQDRALNQPSSARIEVDGVQLPDGYAVDGSTFFRPGLRVLTEGQTLKLVQPPDQYFTSGFNPGAYVNLHGYLEDA